MRRPNVIFFICHDLGKQLGTYGAMVASPNLDRFAERGVRFDNAFCSSPACSPSRCCLMTGKYAHTTGAIGLSHMGWSLSQDVKTVVDYFNEDGYETVHFGLNHERHAGQNHYQLDEERTWDDYDVSNAVDKAVGYLESRVDSSRPFYLNIGCGEVHATSYRRKVDIYGGRVPPEDVYMPHYSPDMPELRREFGMFQAAIRYLDTHFQRLLDACERLGFLEDSVVVFTTDHGISNDRAKGTLYDRGVEVSLLVHLPDDGRNGYSVEHLIQNVDLAPTLLQAAGIEPPADMQGRSFWPLLAGGDYEPHDAIFIERNFHGQKPPGQDGFVDLYDPVRAVRTPECHYIRWFEPGAWHRPWLPFEVEPLIDRARDRECDDREKLWPVNPEPRRGEELYHVRLDPLEFVDVAGRPEYRHVKAELADRLGRWMRGTKDFVMTGEVPARPDEPGWGPDWPRA